MRERMSISRDSETNDELRAKQCVGEPTFFSETPPVKPKRAISPYEAFFIDKVQESKAAGERNLNQVAFSKEYRKQQRDKWADLDPEEKAVYTDLGKAAAGIAKHERRQYKIDMNKFEQHGIFIGMSSLR